MSHPASDYVTLAHGVATVPKYVSAFWEPKEDITAYEVARMLTHIVWHRMTEADWAALGPIQRHWRRVD